MGGAETLPAKARLACNSRRHCELAMVLQYPKEKYPKERKMCILLPNTSNGLILVLFPFAEDTTFHQDILLTFCLILGLYHVAEIQGWTKNKSGDIDVKKAVFWSAASGTLSGIAANPISVIKTRIQSAAHPSIAVGRQYQYKGVLDAFATIYRTEGFRGYFAGINATCARLAIGSGAQLTTFSTAKQALLNNGLFAESKFALAFCASALSGAVVAVAICPFDVATVRLYNQGCQMCQIGKPSICACKSDLEAHIPSSSDTIMCRCRVKAWLLSTELGDSPTLVAVIASVVCAIPVVCVEGPLDVVNTRLLNQGTSGALLYNGVFDCLYKIWKTEGLHGLYKGIGPLYLRIAPHTTLSLVIWDLLNNILTNKRNS
ncbi:mitochondrial carrier protein domain-containing protein [Phthorimaea operculella]|nr:mitochondrial carrier protein domain-containing protein [Phthorimaea operculella]